MKNSCWEQGNSAWLTKKGIQHLHRSHWDKDSTCHQALRPKYIFSPSVSAQGQFFTTLHHLLFIKCLSSLSGLFHYCWQLLHWSQYYNLDQTKCKWHVHLSITSSLDSYLCDGSDCQLHNYFAALHLMSLGGLAIDLEAKPVMFMLRACLSSFC